MANSFAFPPPPPPPPPAASSYYSTGLSYPSQVPQHPQRGRGGFNANFSRGGRGRAEYGGTRGNRSGTQSGYSYQQRNGFSQQTTNNNGHQAHFQPHRQQNFAPAGHNRGVTSGQPKTVPLNQIRAADSYGYKRTHDQAFPRNNAAPKLQTAPAVPSFGFNLPSLVPQQTANSPKIISTVPAKRNLLGLIPVDDDHDSSDEDEESKLAAAVVDGPDSAISFLYKGKLATLKTPEDIAAWIAERRRNFPTAARREAMAKKRVEERAKLLELKEAAREKALGERKEKQGKSSHKQAKGGGKGVAPPDKQPKPGSKSDCAMEENRVLHPSKSSLPLTKEQLKIEKLRRAMEKNAKKLAKLEAASKNGPKILPQHEVTNINLKTVGTDGSSENTSMSDSSMTSSGESSSSDLSSSDGSDASSDSDLDSVDETDESDQESQSDSDVPEELSSTHTAPIRVPPPPRGKEDNRALCRNLKKYGRCQRRGCKFRHKPKDSETHNKRPPAKLEKKPAGKLSLYQRLLKQQIEEDEQAQLGSDKPPITEQTPTTV